MFSRILAKSLGNSPKWPTTSAMYCPSMPFYARAPCPLHYGVLELDLTCTNTPVMQGAKQMVIERRCDCELHRKSCRLGRACVDFLTQVLLLLCLELPRKGSEKGGGIYNARVEVHRDPDTQGHAAHFGGRDSCTAFYWESPTKELFCARHLVNNCRAGA